MSHHTSSSSYPTYSLFLALFLEYLKAYFLQISAHLPSFHSDKIVKASLPFPLLLSNTSNRFDMNPEEVLDNVICARAHNSEQQMELLSEAAALMSDSR